MKVAFYKGKSRVFNKLVSWWTKGPYSHCELVVSGGLGEDSVCYSSSFMDKGVRKSTIKLDPHKWDLVEIKDNPALVEWFEKNLKKPYDLLGLLGFMFRVVDGEKSKYFCSEAVAESLGVKESWRYCPNTLYSLLSFRN